MNLIKQMSLAACRGGASKFREQSNRADMMMEDQLIGQVGTYAGHKFWFGHSYNYLISRQMANIYPGAGDGGSDVVGANIDFKSSRIRGDRPFLDYSLVVRQRERGKNKIYVQLLVELHERSATAYILGWASDSELRLARGGIFDGAYILPVKELQALPPLQWTWIETARQAQETAVYEKV